MMLFCDGRLSSAVSRLPVRKSLNDVKFKEANLDFSLVDKVPSSSLDKVPMALTVLSLYMAMMRFT